MAGSLSLKWDRIAARYLTWLIWAFWVVPYESSVKDLEKYWGSSRKSWEISILLKVSTGTSLPKQSHDPRQMRAGDSGKSWEPEQLPEDGWLPSDPLRPVREKHVPCSGQATTASAGDESQERNNICSVSLALSPGLFPTVRWHWLRRASHLLLLKGSGGHWGNVYSQKPAAWGG